MGRFLFKNRIEAGNKLAERLESYRKDKPIVIALPRGGVIVGAQVSRALNAPLDILAVRKIGAPGNPEFGIGAISEGGILLFNQITLAALGVTPGDLQESVEIEEKELSRRVALYRGGRPPQNFAGGTMIMIDDGFATGVTAQAAVASVAVRNPARVVLAAPVTSTQAAKELRPLVHEFVCLFEIEAFYSVGNWYETFPQVTDQEVAEILQSKL